jgi:DNA-binding transcriptional MocR family regulator
METATHVAPARSFSPPPQSGQPISEAEATAFITTAEKLPPIRTLAAQWNWSKSKVERFLQRPEFARFSASKNETPRETPDGTPALVPPGEQQHEAESEPPLDDADLVVPEQRATWVYPNQGGNITIRQDGAARDEDDQIVVVTPEHAEALALRLKHIAESIFRDREAER